MSNKEKQKELLLNWRTWIFRLKSVYCMYCNERKKITLVTLFWNFQKSKKILKPSWEGNPWPPQQITYRKESERHQAGLQAAASEAEKAALPLTFWGPIKLLTKCESEYWHLQANSYEIFLYIPSLRKLPKDTGHQNERPRKGRLGDVATGVSTGKRYKEFTGWYQRHAQRCQAASGPREQADQSKRRWSTWRDPPEKDLTLLRGNFMRSLKRG